MAENRLSSGNVVFLYTQYIIYFLVYIYIPSSSTWPFFTLYDVYNNIIYLYYYYKFDIIYLSGECFRGTHRRSHSNFMAFYLDEIIANWAALFKYIYIIWKECDVDEELHRWQQISTAGHCVDEKEPLQKSISLETSIFYNIHIPWWGGIFSLYI